MGNTTSLVAVLPDGTEYFEDIRPFPAKAGFDAYDYKRVCENAVRNSGLTTPRANPVPVVVSLFVLQIEKGKLVRRPHPTTYSITPPLERMTPEQYDAEMTSLLNEIPDEFSCYVTSESYDRGHAAGYEECVLIARSMVDGLRPCIVEYRKRLQFNSVEHP